MQLQAVVEETLRLRAPDDRFLLASYYIDGRTLLEIARVLGVHEATISRRLHRVTVDLRKQVLRGLGRAGLSRAAAEEALGADPRDLDLNLKKILQTPPAEAFNRKSEP
jgi:RNA polymerase sigma-70 factor (ECF subfamily)